MRTKPYTEEPKFLPHPPGWNELIEKTFGRLTPLGYSGAMTKHKQKMITCRCECGNYIDVMPSSLTAGYTQSCGCKQRDATIARNISSRTHGESRGGKVTPLYRAWQAIKWRCLDPKHASYALYGGRGITMHPPWINSYEQFSQDIRSTIGDRPERAYSLDRIDNNGNYVPGNLRWATPKEQNRNKDLDTYVIDNLRLTLPEWAERYNMSYMTVSWRVNNGWELIDALTEPVGSIGRHREVSIDEHERMHGIWYSIIARCYDTNSAAYKNYGGRGIDVCDRWRESFDNFFEDVGARPTEKHTLDRIDGNRGYYPDNIRWATNKEQIRNRRSTLRYTFNGVERPLAEWAEMAGVDYEAVKKRVRVFGWSLEEALGTPTGFGRCANGERKKWEGPK